MASSLTGSTAHDCVCRVARRRRASRPRRYRFFVFVAALLLIAVFAAGCDWLQPGFDGGHSYFNPSEPALSGQTVGSLTKQFSLPGAGFSNGPLVVDGQIAYTTADASGDLTVTTVKADSGAPGWTTTLPGVTGYFSRAVSDGTNIYVAVQDVTTTSCGGVTHLAAISATTGAIAWNVTLPGMAGNGCHPGAPTLTLGAGHLYMLRGLELSSTDADYEWTAIDPGTGTPSWNYDTESLSVGTTPPNPRRQPLMIRSPSATPRLGLAPPRSSSIPPMAA